MDNNKQQQARATKGSSGSLERCISMQIRALEGAENDRKFEISFSSEEPYTRWFGPEILDHSGNAVDLSRLNEIGVVLFNHDRDVVLGKINRAWIEDGRGKAEIEFDTDETAETIRQKVASGTLKGVSVGYSVGVWEDVEAGQMSSDGRFQGPCSIAKRWMPYEVSIVSVPADATVGVGRELDAEYQTHETREAEAEQIEKNNSTKEEKQMENTNTAPATSVDTEAVAQRAAEAERARITGITAMCRDFGIDADPFVKDAEMTEDKCRAAILEQLKERKAPKATGVKVTEDEGDKFRAAAVDALQMRSGSVVANPAAGANELRSMSLRDLASECLVRFGGKTDSEVRRMSADDLYVEMQRQYFNPTAAFPAILDETIRKNIVQLYQAVPTTFQEWCTKGSVSDFKPTPDHNYIIGGGSFEKVPENGELKQSKPSTELLPTRKVDTYGTQFTMSRQAFVNDDIGFLSNVPGVYAAAAKRKINRQVYELLFNNSATIFDGKVLFCSDHGNHDTTGAAPTLSTINKLMLKMQAQKDPFGEAINVAPRMLVLPIGYGLDVDTILHSTSITTGESNNTGYNPMANKGLTYVEDAEINALAGSNAAPWFLVANPMTAKSIQVDYLNGQEVPNIRRSEVPGRLGFVWDIFLDWGITVVDYRGIARNNGLAITI